MMNRHVHQLGAPARLRRVRVVAGRRFARRGMLIVFVLVMISVLGLLGASFAFRTNADLAAVKAQQDQQQALFAVRSGIERVILDLREGRLDMANWYSNQKYRRMAVYLPDLRDDKGEGKGGSESITDQDKIEGRRVWRVSIVATEINEKQPERSQIRYGLIDEASKINLNIATRSQLLALVDQVKHEDLTSEDLVDALLAWRGKANGRGPADSYYRTLKPAYGCKHAPLASVDELLMIKGFDGRILYGEDYNRNGYLDLNENDGEEEGAFPPDDNDGLLHLGLLPYVTVYSWDWNRANDNRQRTPFELIKSEQPGGEGGDGAGGGGQGAGGGASPGGGGLGGPGGGGAGAGGGGGAGGLGGLADMFSKPPQVVIDEIRPEVLQFIADAQKRGYKFRSVGDLLGLEVYEDGSSNHDTLWREFAKRFKIAENRVANTENGQADEDGEQDGEGGEDGEQNLDGMDGGSGGGQGKGQDSSDGEAKPGDNNNADQDQQGNENGPQDGPGQSKSGQSGFGERLDSRDNANNSEDPDDPNNPNNRGGGSKRGNDPRRNQSIRNNPGSSNQNDQDNQNQGGNGPQRGGNRGSNRFGDNRNNNSGNNSGFGNNSDNQGRGGRGRDGGQGSDQGGGRGRGRGQNSGGPGEGPGQGNAPNDNDIDNQDSPQGDQDGGDNQNDGRGGRRRGGRGRDGQGDGQGQGDGTGGGGEDRKGTPIVSPVEAADMPAVMDRLTVWSTPVMAGLINVNTAPKAVLQTIPGLTEQDAESIVSKRQQLQSVDKLTPAWLVTAGAIDSEKFALISNMVTTRSLQFTIDAVGFADHVGTVKRVQAVVEMRGQLAQIKYYRDITSLGVGYPVWDDQRSEGLAFSTR